MPVRVSKIDVHVEPDYYAVSILRLYELKPEDIYISFHLTPVHSINVLVANEGEHAQKPRVGVPARHKYPRKLTKPST